MFFRVQSKDHASPFFFSSDRKSRFNPVHRAGRGASYWALSLEAAIAETLSRKFESGDLVRLSRFDDFVYWLGALEKVVDIADLMGTSWRGCGITAELCTIAPEPVTTETSEVAFEYDISLEWASWFDEEDYDGVYYTCRHFGDSVDGPSARAIAMFGPAGPNKDERLDLVIDEAQDLRKAQVVGFLQLCNFAYDEDDDGPDDEDLIVLS